MSSGAAMDSNTVTIQNTPPEMISVDLTPLSASESSTLTCSPTGTDADGDGLTFSYAWTVNGSAISATGDTLTGAAFDSGDSVQCVVSADDGTASGAAMPSNTVTIGNTAPVMTGVTLTPVTAYETTTLTCTPAATDGDGDAVTFSYAWTVNGSAIAPTTSTLTGTHFDKTDSVACAATPDDGTGSGAAMSSAAVTVQNSLPVASAVALTPTAASESSTLTCAPSGSDADGTTLSYTYNWYVNGALIAPTTSTLTGTYFNNGNTVYCQATANDGSATSAAVASNTVTISNSAPVISSVALTPTTAYEATTLTCAPTATDADGDAISYSYAWYVNSSLIAPTTSTLTGTYFSRGNTVYCRATPTDGTNAGTAVSSNTVTISNTAPTAPVVDITPAAPVENVDNLVCGITTASTDADGDAISYTITWTADGASYPSAVAGASGPITTTRTNDTVPATDTDLATTWVCTVTPADSSGSGAAGTDSVTVTPSATPCSGGTLEVGWLPGWGGTYTSSSLTWANIEANALPYGTCSINITNTGGSFTLATLMAYDVLIIGDPSGYSIQYTAGELAAINSYLTGGYGGAVATYLMKFVTYDNSSLKSLFGVSSASLTNTNTAITTGATVVMPSHPIVANVPTSFTLLGFSYEQGVTGGWSSVALDATADFVVQGAGQSTVIANDTGTYRTVYFTTMADYNTPNNDTRQMLYDSLIWAAGY